MQIFQIDSALVASHRFGVDVLPPDGKRRIDEGAEVFGFGPTLDGARAMDAGEVSLLQRSRIHLMQKQAKPLHCAGIHENLLFASTAFVGLIEDMSPGCHQVVPLHNVWFHKGTEPVPGTYSAVLIMDYAATVDLEHAKVRRTFVDHRNKTAIRLAAIFPKDRVIHAETGDGRHIWADDPTGAVFCSGAFRGRAEKLPGRLGITFAECTTFPRAP